MSLSPTNSQVGNGNLSRCWVESNYEKIFGEMDSAIVPLLGEVV